MPAGNRRLGAMAAVTSRTGQCEFTLSQGCENGKFPGYNRMIYDEESPVENSSLLLRSKDEKYFY